MVIFHDTVAIYAASALDFELITTIRYILTFLSAVYFCNDNKHHHTVLNLTSIVSMFNSADVMMRCFCGNIDVQIVTFKHLLLLFNQQYSLFEV